MLRRFFLFIAFILLSFTALRIINPWLADSIVSFVRNFSFFSLSQSPVLSIQSNSGEQQNSTDSSGLMQENFLEWQIGVWQSSGWLDDLFMPLTSNQTGASVSWNVSFLSWSWWSTFPPFFSWSYVSSGDSVDNTVILLRRIDALEQEIDRLVRENTNLGTRLSSRSVDASTWSRTVRQSKLPASVHNDEADLYFFYETIR